LPVTWEHANAVRKLPNLHRDPFDRILIAQAITEPLRFMTADRTLADYSELVVLI
jgi:PIN domain nuclease of toxin-antitoxin system